MSPFDFLNAINDTKKDMFADPQAAKDYAPFLINRGLSYFSDSVLYANEMNRLGTVLDKEVQFDFYLHALPKRKRFSKWFKKDVSTSQLEAVKLYYKYNEARALEALSILSDEKIIIIEEKLYKGGTT